MATKVRTRDPAVEKVLEDLRTTPPSPYSPTASPYAHTASPYSASPYQSGSPYIPAVATDTRAASPYDSSPYRSPWHRRTPKPGRSKRKLIRRTVVPPPVNPPESGRLFYLPACEYEQCFDICWGQDAVWEDHSVILFSGAAEAASWLYEVENDDECLLRAIEIPDEEHSFTPCDCIYEEPVLLPDARQAARELRTVLIGDPELFLDMVELSDLRMIHTWCGEQTWPGTAEILQAIAEDTEQGLGAAALDFAVWQISHRLGTDGKELSRILDEIEKDDWPFRRAPMENFLLTNGFHPGTDVEPLHGTVLIAKLYGDYVIARVNYRTDPNVVGYRSLFLHPYGEPQMPDLSDPCY